MTTALAPEADPVDRELRHIRDLVVVREAMRSRGAAAAELRECDLVIGEARERLAESTRRVLARDAAA